VREELPQDPDPVAEQILREIQPHPVLVPACLLDVSRRVEAEPKHLVTLPTDGLHRPQELPISSWLKTKTSCDHHELMVRSLSPSWLG